MSPKAAILTLRALEQSSQPLNITELAKAIPKTALKAGEHLPKILRQLSESGQVRSHRARSTVYWLPGLEEQAGARILEALSDGPLTTTELKSRLRGSLPGWPQQKRDEMLAVLIKEKRIHKVAPLTGRTMLLGVRAEPAPQDYIRFALRQATAKLKLMGFTADQIFAASQDLLQQGMLEDKRPFQLLPDKDLSRTILERMIQLKLAAANGEFLSLSELRRSLVAEIPGEAAFDQAVLQLAKSGRIALHLHDYPGNLSQEEREALVLDEHGAYYISAALRSRIARSALTSGLTKM